MVRPTRTQSQLKAIYDLQRKSEQKEVNKKASGDSRRGTFKYPDRVKNPDYVEGGGTGGPSHIYSVNSYKRVRTGPPKYEEEDSFYFLFDGKDLLWVLPCDMPKTRLIYLLRVIDFLVRLDMAAREIEPTQLHRYAAKALGSHNELGGPNPPDDGWVGGFFVDALPWAVDNLVGDTLKKVIEAADALNEAADASLTNAATTALAALGIVGNLDDYRPPFLPTIDQLEKVKSKSLGRTLPIPAAAQQQAQGQPPTGAPSNEDIAGASWAQLRDLFREQAAVNREFTAQNESVLARQNQTDATVAANYREHSARQNQTDATVAANYREHSARQNQTDATVAANYREHSARLDNIDAKLTRLGLDQPEDGGDGGGNQNGGVAAQDGGGDDPFWDDNNSGDLAQNHTLDHDSNSEHSSNSDDNSDGSNSAAWYNEKELDEIFLVGSTSSPVPVANGKMLLQRNRTSPTMTRMVVGQFTPLEFTAVVDLKQSSTDGQTFVFFPYGNGFFGVRSTSLSPDQLEEVLTEFWVSSATTASSATTKSSSGELDDDSDDAGFDSNGGGGPDIRDGDDDIGGTPDLDGDGGGQSNSESAQDANEICSSTLNGFESAEKANNINSTNSSSSAGKRPSSRSDDGSSSHGKCLSLHNAAGADDEDILANDGAGSSSDGKHPSSRNADDSDDDGLHSDHLLVLHNSDHLLVPGAADHLPVLHNSDHLPVPGAAAPARDEVGVSTTAITSASADGADGNLDGAAARCTASTKGGTQNRGAISGVQSNTLAENGSNIAAEMARLSVGSDDSHEDYVSVFGYFRRQNGGSLSVATKESTITDEKESIENVPDCEGEGEREEASLSDGSATEEASLSDGSATEEASLSDGSATEEASFIDGSATKESSLTDNKGSNENAPDDEDELEEAFLGNGDATHKSTISTITDDKESAEDEENDKYKEASLGDGSTTKESSITADNESVEGEDEHEAFGMNEPVEARRVVLGVPVEAARDDTNNQPQPPGVGGFLDAANGLIASLGLGDFTGSPFWLGRD